MSQNPTSPEQPDSDEGTFVGGTFGRPDEGARDDLSTAQELDVEQQDPAPLADLQQSAPAQEFADDVDGPSTESAGAASFGQDVEGTTGEPAPGERNEPV